jgi:hypothetical protein
MTSLEILEELKQLTPAERLRVIEEALQFAREELQQMGLPIRYTPKQQRLSVAAEALRQDYAAGGELTAFTALDGETFDASR